MYDGPEVLRQEGKADVTRLTDSASESPFSYFGLSGESGRKKKTGVCSFFE